MGCTLIYVGSLTVLILASLIGNMKVASDIQSTMQNTELETLSTPSSIKIVTIDQDLGVTDKHFIETNPTEPYVYKDANITLIHTYNCTDSSYNMSTQTNCSTVITTSSNLVSLENATKKIITYRDFKEYIYYRNIVTIAPYVANVPGMITNILTILISANIKPRHASEIYMIALGSADFITVLSRCANQLLLAFEINNSASCRLPQYIAHMALIYSNMVLMSWTIERFIAVMFPMKIATYCSIRNTKITLIPLLLLCMLLGTPYITEFDVYSYATGDGIVFVCFATKFMTSVWTHMESIYYIYVPVLCVCGCNIAILCRLRTMTKARIKMASNQETIDKKASENRKMTILLLSISGCFLVLHIPYAIIMVFHYIYPDIHVFILEDPHFFAKFIFYSSCGYIITEYQNTVNFFLYCISGSKFRLTFWSLFCQTKEQTKPQSIATRSSNV